MSDAVEVELQNMLPALRGASTYPNPRVVRAGSPGPMIDRKHSAPGKQVVSTAATTSATPIQGHHRQRTQTADQSTRKGFHSRGLSTNDTPAMELPTVPNTIEEASEYWQEYDKAADKHDKDMVGGLGENVDILLVFAGLFSGVNTAFIILSLALLSSGPSDETNALLRSIIQQFDNSTLGAAETTPSNFVPTSNAIRINCFFAASLSCSLLAAFGAMLGKQWVGHYKRTGQLGPLHTQGRQRQRKFNAVERYHFCFVVEALPTLLQISVLLFFVGLINFLWILNEVVGLVVLAFALLGLVAYAFTIFVATRDPHCPFQTPVSTATSRALPPIRRCFGYAKWWWAELKKLMASQLSGGTHEPLSIQDDPNAIVDHWEVDKATIYWILENSARAEARLAAAQIIPALSPPQPSDAVLNDDAFRQLVSLFKGSLNQLVAFLNRSSTLVLGESESVRAVVLYGRAICHSLIRGSPSSEILKRKNLKSELVGVDSKHTLFRMLLNKGMFHHCYELVILCECLIDPKSHSPDVDYIDISVLPLYLVSFPVLMEGQDRWGILKLARYALSNSPTERIIGLAAWSLSAIKAEDNMDVDNEDLWKRRWEAYTGHPNMFKHLLSALEAYELHARPAIDRKQYLKPQHNEAYADLLHATVSLPYDRHLPQHRSLVLNSPQLLASMETLLETLFLQVQALLDHAPSEAMDQLGIIGKEEKLAALRHLQGEALALVNQLFSDPHRQVELSLDPKPIWRTVTTAMGDFGVLSEVLTAMVHTEGDKKDYIGLFHEYPMVSRAIVDGLCHPSDGVWRAAVELVSWKGKTWVDHNDPEVHKQFHDAGLALGLAKHLDEAGKVNQTVSVLLQRPEWRARFASAGFVDAVYEAMMMTRNRSMDTELVEPSIVVNGFFHTIELWSFCSSHSEFQEPLTRWMSDEMVAVVRDLIWVCAQYPSRDIRIPTQIRAYIGASQTAAIAGPDTIQSLATAFEEMKVAWELLAPASAI